MKKFLLAGTFVAFVPLALAPVAAVAQTPPQDLAFISSTTHMDLASIVEGQNAISVSTNPGVKTFAQEMVTFHTQENQVVPPMLPPAPSTISPCTFWQSELVRKSDPGKFDTNYLLATYYNHRRLVNVFQGEITAGVAANLKDYAQKTLPIVQQHLAEAQQLLQGGTMVMVQPPTHVVVRPDHPNFRSGQWDLSGGDQAVLNDLANKLKGLTNVKVVATGYTDTVRIGPELKKMGVTTNQILSEKRAGSVKDYLVAHGVSADEIQTQGMGEANPVASNATEEGKAQNRRVEVDVTGIGPGTQTTMAHIPEPAESGIPDCND